MEMSSWYLPGSTTEGLVWGLREQRITNLELHDSRISCYRVLQRYVLSTAFLIA